MLHLCKVWRWYTLQWELNKKDNITVLKYTFIAFKNMNFCFFHVANMCKYFIVQLYKLIESIIWKCWIFSIFLKLSFFFLNFYKKQNASMERKLQNPYRQARAHPPLAAPPVRVGTSWLVLTSPKASCVFLSPKKNHVKSGTYFESIGIDFLWNQKQAQQNYIIIFMWIQWDWICAKVCSITPKKNQNNLPKRLSE